MSNSTISTFQLIEMFPDQESPRAYLESRLWQQRPKCPVCDLGERITKRKDGFSRCNQCKEDFTVRTGSIFERNHVPLHKWVYAMYLLVTESAWFVPHRRPGALRLRAASRVRWRETK